MKFSEVWYTEYFSAPQVARVFWVYGRIEVTDMILQSIFKCHLFYENHIFKTKFISLFLNCICYCNQQRLFQWIVFIHRNLDLLSKRNKKNKTRNDIFFTMRENDFRKKKEDIFGFEFFVHVKYTCLNLFQSLLHWNISLINILIFLDIKNILSKISLVIKQRSRENIFFNTIYRFFCF